MAFTDIYPNGLKHTIVLFQKALYDIMTTDEIDHVIKYCPRWRERRHLKRLKEEFRAQAKDWTDAHWIISVEAIQSPCLFKDIIAYMIMKDHLPTYKGEDE